MTQSDPVIGRIQSFLLERFPAARKRGLSREDRLLDTGVLDSLGILDLVSFVEQEFGVTISDDELLPENFQSIEAIAAFVLRKRNGSGSPDGI
jgi:acyl carrier protein